MPNFTLNIILDDGKYEYAIGDTIRGAVEVIVSAPCPCHELSVTTMVEVSGKGDGETAKKSGKVLFQGQWNELGTYHYRFELETPKGPLTYQGDHMNIDWYVSANADIPWALDPKAIKKISLTRGDYVGKLGHGGLGPVEWENLPPEQKESQKRLG